MSSRDVPCGDCSACCRGELIVLHPEDGDVVARYRTRRVTSPLTGRAVTALRQRPDGRCIYLGEAGCTIYDQRPAICRGFDCRRMLAMFAAGAPLSQLLGAIAASPVLAAGARLVAHEGKPNG